MSAIMENGRIGPLQLAITWLDSAMLDQSKLRSIG